LIPPPEILQGIEGSIVEVLPRLNGLKFAGIGVFER